MNKANKADERLTAVNDIVSTKIISQFTICLLMLNKQTVCGILRPLEWQKYLQASEKLSALLQPVVTLDRHLTGSMKRKLCPLPPPSHPLALCFLFPFLSFSPSSFFFSKTSTEDGERHSSCCVNGVNYVSSVAGSSRLLMCLTFQVGDLQ